MKRDLARELFRSYKTPSRKKVSTNDVERVNRDEPTSIADTLSELIEKKEWRSGLAEGNLFLQIGRAHV